MIQLCICYYDLVVHLRMEQLFAINGHCLSNLKVSLRLFLVYCEFSFPSFGFVF